MNSIEKTVLKYLETRNDGWSWFFGGRRLTREETIQKFKRDKQFRTLVVTQVEKVAIEMFEKAMRAEGKL